MLRSKKALETHIIVIIVISFVMTIFLTVLLDVFYEPDIAECLEIDFQIDFCERSAGFYELEIINNWDKRLDFEINSQVNDDFGIIAGNSKRIVVRESAENALRVVPIINKDGNTYKCRASSESMELNLIRKC
jgi:hypothetical protein